jgi:ABC-type branched-subunit amino acid transport system ATPase component
MRLDRMKRNRRDIPDAKGHIARRAAVNAECLLDARSMTVGYGRTVVVREMNLQVKAGQVVALLGPNGAGKTTTLLAVSGVLAPLSGAVFLFGEAMRAPLYRRAQLGMAYVPEERSVFKSLTTLDNLRLARGDIDGALNLFPELRSRLRARAGDLSGGEQQMLVMARALSRGPRLLLADELSLGLAPLAVQRLFEAIQIAAASGVGILIVEQHIRQVLRIADYAYIMRRGRIELAGSGDDIVRRIGDVEDSYLTKKPVPSPEL